MYIPGFNRVTDPSKINAFIHAHGFGIVITHKDGATWASHLPVLLDEKAGEHGLLRSHMARANEQWKHFQTNEEVLCIFNGPHAYISPSWYVEQHTVPTWNYATVHVYGTATLTDEAELKQIVRDTTEKYESGMPVPWELPLSEDELDKMAKAIVGFTIRITRVEAKFKLGQNRSPEDQAKMLQALQDAPDAETRALGEFIARERASEL